MKILVIQKSAVLCQRIITLLEASHRYAAVGIAGDPYSALSLMRADPPDALLLDLHLADGAALKLLEKMQAHALHLPVVLLAESRVPAYLQRAEELGVRAVLLKENDFGQIVSTLDDLLLTHESVPPPAH